MTRPTDNLNLQPDLFGAGRESPPDAAPAGFRLQPGLITPDEAADLAEALERVEFRPFEFQGWKASRLAAWFGHRYDYGSGALEAASPIPDWLIDLRGRVAAFAGLAAADFAQVLVNRYPPGAGIGWHRDRRQFGLVAGVSLLSPARLRFRRKAGERWERWAAPLEPRSIYLLDGPARSEWEHSIAAHQAERVSITFRTLA